METERAVEPRAVVKDFDPFKDGSPGFTAGGEAPLANEFALQRAPEAFHDGAAIKPAIASRLAASLIHITASAATTFVFYPEPGFLNDGDATLIAFGATDQFGRKKAHKNYEQQQNDCCKQDCAHVVKGLADSTLSRHFVHTTTDWICKAGGAERVLIDE